MKSLFSVLIVSALSLGSFSALAASKKKMTQDAAKKECLKEDAQLKGKALQKCIAKKRK